MAKERYKSLNSLDPGVEFSHDGEAYKLYVYTCIAYKSVLRFLITYPFAQFALIGFMP